MAGVHPKRDVRGPAIPAEVTFPNEHSEQEADVEVGGRAALGWGIDGRHRRHCFTVRCHVQQSIARTETRVCFTVMCHVKHRERTGRGPR